MNQNISNLSQVAYVRRYILTEGAEAGLRVTEIYNGRLRVLLNESRAMDLMQMFHGGINLSFVSKNGWRAQSLPFLNRFEGGMLYTCGLDSIGGREGFELHGTHHLTPAKVLSVDCNEERIEVKAEVQESALFGQNLRLIRTVKTAVGSDTLEISDELTNLGYTDARYCLLYHINLGFPMLDGGTVIKTEQGSVKSRNAFAAEGLADRCIVQNGVPDLEERCYFLYDNTPHVEVENPTLGKRFILEYSKDTLPAFVQWNSFCAADYALGLEPATTYLDDEFAYQTLEANQTVRFSLAFTVAQMD